MDDGSSETSPQILEHSKKNTFASFLERFRPKPRETPLVKETWFKGYVEGNVLWPQSMSGVTIKLLDQLLQDPPADFRQFFNSKLSPAQLEQLGMYMSKIHHANDVNHATKPHMESTDKLVLDKRFQTLWESAALGAGLVILNYVNYQNSKSSLMPAVIKDNRPENKFWLNRQMGDVNKFFREHPDDLGDLITATRTASETLSSSEGVNLSLEFRALISKKSTSPFEKQNQTIHANSIQDSMGKLVWTNLKNSLPKIYTFKWFSEPTNLTGFAY